MRCLILCSRDIFCVCYVFSKLLQYAGSLAIAIEMINTIELTNNPNAITAVGKDVRSLSVKWLQQILRLSERKK